MATRDMCACCFRTLLANFKKQPIPDYGSKEAYPLFVTWTETRTHDLRGCIGTFEPKPLAQLLPRYALVSALKDSRFPPISMKQLPGLTVAVSLLVNFEKGKKALEWKVGVDGIIIEFQVEGQEYSATFLPEVAGQQGWDHEQTLRHLVRKAGFKGSLAKIIDLIRVTTYQSSKVSLSYEEFVKEYP